MKRFLLCLLPLALPAQSIVARFPYAPASPSPALQLLNVPAKLAVLNPVTIERPPLGLPDELAYRPEELPWLQKLRTAHSFMAQGAFAEALVLLEEFLEKFPQHAPTRITHADCLFALKRYDAAEKSYLDFLKDFPMNYQALNNLAWMYATVQDPAFFRPDESIRLARKALLVSPESHHVWSTLSQAFFALKNYAEAERSAQTALIAAQRSQAGASVEVPYLIQIDRCRAALLATSLME